MMSSTLRRKSVGVLRLKCSEKSRPVSEQVLHGAGHDLGQFFDSAGEGGLLPSAGMPLDAKAEGVSAEVGQPDPVVIFGWIVRSELFTSSQDQLLAADIGVKTARGLVLFEQREESVAGRIELGRQAFPRLHVSRG